LSVTAFEPDIELVRKYKRKYYNDISCIDYSQTEELIRKNVQFDSVLCSLVLCHPLASTKKDRTQKIEKIMNNIIALSRRYIILTICNPFYTHQSNSEIQVRILPKHFNYYKETKFSKKVYSSGNERYDIHRPISFYENLFKENKLNILKVIQTRDSGNTQGIENSDFIIFVLSK